MKEACKLIQAWCRLVKIVWLCDSSVERRWSLPRTIQTPRPHCFHHCRQTRSFKQRAVAVRLIVVQQASTCFWLRRSTNLSLPSGRCYWR